jgi:putative salt-induced outer membrane protein YdiY
MQQFIPRVALATTISLCSITATADAEPVADPPSSWKRELDVGINGSSGNTDSLSGHLGFKAGYEDTHKKWRFDSAYDNASTDGETNRNQFFADLQRDWLWTDSPWFAFAQGRYDWDEFRAWDSRISVSAGPGYQFIDNDSWNVRGRLGLGGYQTFGDDDSGFVPEALLGFNADWTISERESLEFATTFFPNLEDSGEFRNITTLDWKMKMNERGSLAMKIGLSNEYDSLAAEGTEKNDFKYYLALVWAM